MKRILVVAATVALVALMSLAYVGSRLSAQAGGQAPQQAPQLTRVAFVNIAKIFQDYEKAKFYKKEMELAIEPKRLLREKLAKEIVHWKTDMSKPTFDPKEKERYERGILNNQRQLEDLEREIRQMLGQRNEQQYLQLYKELSDAVGRYALANNIQVVLAYVEPTQGDPFSLMNIMRKVQGMDMSGGMTGMFMASGLDISTAVVDQLNHNYRAAGGAAVPNITPTSFPPKN